MIVQEESKFEDLSFIFGVCVEEQTDDVIEVVSIESPNKGNFGNCTCDEILNFLFVGSGGGENVPVEKSGVL